jgi:hypothetical protein
VCSPDDLQPQSWNSCSHHMMCGMCSDKTDEGLAGKFPQCRCLLAPPRGYGGRYLVLHRRLKVAHHSRLVRHARHHARPWLWRRAPATNSHSATSSWQVRAAVVCGQRTVPCLQCCLLALSREYGGRIPCATPETLCCPPTMGATCPPTSDHAMLIAGMFCKDTVYCVTHSCFP